MSGSHRLSIWQGLPFVVRLLTTASLALLIASATMLYSSVSLDAVQTRQDLRQDLSAELETLPPSLAELVVIGDFATLQQTLDRFVSRPRIRWITYRDISGASLTSQDPTRQAAVPDWFLRWLDVPDQVGTAKVVVGGRHYGDLSIGVTAQGAILQSWHRLLNHLAILLLAVSMDFIGIWLVLRHGLRPLRHVRHGALALAQGRWDTRLIEQGSPEFRDLIRAFNTMVAATGKAQQDLQRSNDDLLRLAEVSAHHLQEPSRRLISHAQKLKRELTAYLAENPNALHTMNYVVDQAHRMRALVHDVQWYLAADQPLGVVESLDLRALWDDLRPGGAGDQAYVWHCQSPLPRISMDWRRAKVLLECLLDNCCRFRHPDQPLQVEFSADRHDGMVCCRLMDNGIGIEPVYRQRVFDIFERLQAPQSAEDGTGIGLSIARRIVQSVGGTIEITDGLQSGITVVFTLPAGDEEC